MSCLLFGHAIIYNGNCNGLCDISWKESNFNWFFFFFFFILHFPSFIKSWLSLFHECQAYYACLWPRLLIRNSHRVHGYTVYFSHSLQMDLMSLMGIANLRMVWRNLWRGSSWTLPKTSLNRCWPVFKLEAIFVCCCHSSLPEGLKWTEWCMVSIMLESHCHTQPAHAKLLLYPSRSCSQWRTLHASHLIWISFAWQHAASLWCAVLYIHWNQATFGVNLMGHASCIVNGC